ncbi:MAG TPA: hypothetical protein DIW26_00275 [Ruminococcus sp.]|nr:hypothetical protein [Ruminococcus sp.]
MNFKKNLIFLSALALCGSAAFSGFGNNFALNISATVDENIAIQTADDNEITDSGKCGENIEWAYYEKTSTLILSGTGDMYNYGGIDEAGIDGDEPDYYKYADNIKNIIINDGVTSIGNGAFHGNMGDNCYVIESISIPDSVKTIGDSAFCQIANVGKVLEALGDTKVENIGTYAFHWSGGSCEKCVIPETVKSIGYGAFGYTGIYSVVIPKNLSYENIKNAGFGYYMDNISGTYYGYKGSDAEKFVNDMNATDPSELTLLKIDLKFIALDSEPETPAETTEPETPTETAAWKDAYKEILKSCDVANAAYGLYDLDNDGIPELFVSSGFSHAADVLVYTYDSDNVIKLDDYVYGSWGAIDILKDSGELVSSHSGQGISICSLYKKTGDKMEQVISYWDNAGAVEDGAEYKINEQNVSKEEYFDSYDSHFKGKEVLTIGNDNSSVSDLSLIDNYAKEDLNDEPKETENNNNNTDDTNNDTNDNKNTDDTNNNNNNTNNNNNNNNNNNKNNTTNNGGKSATADKTGVSPDTGDKGTGIALCVAASAVMAAWITRKKD